MGNIDLTEIIKFIFPPALGLAGAYFGYLFAVKKERIAKRQELKINFLIDVYRKLANLQSRDLNNKDFVTLESCISDIQLFGSLTQIDLTDEFARECANDYKGNPGKLIAELRKELRTELGLKPTKELFSLRLTKIEE